MVALAGGCGWFVAVLGRGSLVRTVGRFSKTWPRLETMEAVAVRSFL